jgi:phosphonate transport system substrate-binding protein
MELQTAIRPGCKGGMNSLTLTSCLGENTEPVCEDLAEYLAYRLRIQVDFEGELSWKERSRRIDTGEIGMAWICGLLYIQKVDLADIFISPLVAPVMSGETYQQMPIYTSKIIVHRDSDYYTFNDLRGARFAINEPDSYSGWVLVHAHLASLGGKDPFFAELVESGSHSQSMQWVANGKAAAAAIDCTVFNYLTTQDPHLARMLRVVEDLGPSPAPLFVISRTVPQNITRRIRQLMLNMAADEDGRKILASGNLSRFTAVEDQDYNPIRQKARQAGAIQCDLKGYATMQ